MEKLKSAFKKQGKKKFIKGRQTVVFQSSKKNLAYYDPEILNLLKLRKKTLVEFNGRDATPHALCETDFTDIEEIYLVEQKQNRNDSLWDALASSVSRKRFSSLSDLARDSNVDSLVPDLDDICQEIAEINLADLYEESDTTTKKKDKKTKIENKKPEKFVEIIINETENFDIYEFKSLITPKGTQEANSVEQYNAHYNFITKGAGMSRPRGDAETQTEIVSAKPVGNNTVQAEKEKNGTNVSKFEIFQAYSEIVETTEEIDETLTVTTLEREGNAEFSNNLFDTKQFQLTSMMVERMLAENVYRDVQKQFRNIVVEDPIDVKINYSYELKELWSYKSEQTKGKEVVSMCWCPSNGDLLAVAYGAYHFRPSKNRIAGVVLIWSMKNPVNPERHFYYKTPVTSIAFSNLSPNLLAVGLYTGSVEVIDISENNSIQKGSTVSRSEKKTSPGFDPVWNCCWILDKDEEFIFTASQDGRIMKYKFGAGPDLIGFSLLHLERVNGTLNGNFVGDIRNDAADGHSQALSLQFHPDPEKSDIYYVGTNQGCVHVCSTNISNQHLSVSYAHKFGVYSIDFSPFSPKVFLTAGSDFCIRIWIEDVLDPVLELKDGFEGVHCAFWSPSNSTVIISCTKSAVKIWDLRRRQREPAAIFKFGNKNFTVIKFSSCGRTIAIGDTEGATHICLLENFPAVPHFQLDALMNCLGVKNL